MRHLAKPAATGAFNVLLAISASSAQPQTKQPELPAAERTLDLVETLERQVKVDRNALGIPGMSILNGNILSARKID